MNKKQLKQKLIDMVSSYDKTEVEASIFVDSMLKLISKVRVSEISQTGTTSKKTI